MLISNSCLQRPFLFLLFVASTARILTRGENNTELLYVLTTGQSTSHVLYNNTEAWGFPTSEATVGITCLACEDPARVQTSKPSSPPVICTMGCFRV